MVPPGELEGVDFLRHLSPAYSEQIASLASLKEYRPGDVIFREGERRPEVYLVLEGEAGLEIRVPGCGVIEAHTVGPGELLGWSAVLGGGPMTATAQAATRCRLAALSADAVVALAEREPRFGLEFYRGLSAALAGRLHATRQQIPESARDKFRALREAAD
jgi:CRP-like cAMP-binding protein